jgi:outer membrane protein
MQFSNYICRQNPVARIFQLENINKQYNLKFMKHIHFIIEGVLTAAVIALFVLHFCGKKESCPVTAENISTLSSASGSIVYVNIDTLLNHYDAYSDMRNELEAKQKNAAADMDAKSRVYQKNLMDYQNKAQKGLITRSEAQQMEQQLSNDQQNLLAYREKLAGDLNESQVVMQRKLIDDIQVYLKEFNKSGKFTYILSNTFGGTLLYVPDSLNITTEVLKGINEQYASKKKK